MNSYPETEIRERDENAGKYLLLEKNDHFQRNSHNLIWNCWNNCIKFASTFNIGQ